MRPTIESNIRERVKAVLAENQNYKLLGFGKSENRYYKACLMGTLNIKYLEDPPYEYFRCGDTEQFIYFSVEGKTKLDNRKFSVPTYLEDLTNYNAPLLKHRTITL